MTGKELSAVLAECAARTEIARAGVEEARKRQEAATARQETATAKLGEVEDRWSEMAMRQEKMLQEYIRRTDEMINEGQAWLRMVTAEFNDQRDERRALMEALFRLMDRLPPPPPHLRSA
jgi:chromosome segregation ATPase